MIGDLIDIIYSDFFSFSTNMQQIHMNRMISIALENMRVVHQINPILNQFYRYYDRICLLCTRFSILILMYYFAPEEVRVLGFRHYNSSLFSNGRLRNGSLRA